MREDPAHVQPALALQLGGAHEGGGRIPTLEAVAAETGVHLELHDGAVSGCRGAFQLRQRADAEIDARLDRRSEVGLLSVQPGQYRRVDAGGSQGEGLIQVGYTQPVGPGIHHGLGDPERPVPVCVRLDHGHREGRCGQLAQHPEVRPNGAEVDACFAQSAHVSPRSVTT